MPERLTADDLDCLRALRDRHRHQAEGIEACMSILMGASVSQAMARLRGAGRRALEEGGDGR